MEMDALGRLVLAEAFGCDRHVLDDVPQVQAIMVGAAEAAGAEVLEVSFHRFKPQGVSGVVVISESHLAVHTWPELGYAAIDVFTCGDKVDPWTACRHILDRFRATSVSANEVKRGILEASRRAAAV
jgi:S-adenosylmethionine decarboxylase